MKLMAGPLVLFPLAIFKNRRVDWALPINELPDWFENELPDLFQLVYNKKNPLTFEKNE